MLFAVPHIKDICRSGQTVQALSVYDDCILLFFDFDAECLEAADSCEAVCAFEKVVDFSRAVRNSPKHHAAVGDGFVSGYRYLSFESCNTA